MKRTLPLLFFFLLFQSATYAQTWLSVQHAGLNHDDFGNAVCTDSLGNVYVTGTFADSVQFGPFQVKVSGTLTDIFLVKYDASMNVVWAKSFGSAGGDGVGAVKTDQAGNIYLTGGYVGAMNFGGGVTLPAAVTRGIYIVKLNSSGTALWAVNAHASGTNSGFETKGLALDAANNIFVTGNFAGVADFGNNVGLSSVLHPQFQYGSIDIFTAKYNSAGVCQWARSGGSYQTDQSFGIAVTPAGTSYITGYYAQAAIFSGLPLTYHGGGVDAVIAGYDNNGNLILIESVYSTGYETAYGIALDAFQNIYITGMSEGPTVIDTITLIPNGNYNMFIAKFNNAGNIQWVSTSIGTQWEDGKQVAVDTRGDVYVGGNLYHGGTSAFPGTVNFLSAGNYDPFLAKYNHEGEFQWARRGGSVYTDGLNGMAVSNAGKIIITGTYGQDATFGNTTILNANPGTMDIFVAALQSDLTTNPVTGMPKCAGSQVTVSYKANMVFNAGNVFTAQLSDSQGRFANAVNIGTKVSTVSGSMTATLPAGTPPGNGYRIRVIASDSVRTGSDNGTDLTIWGVASAVATAAGTDFCSGDSLQINAPTGAGYSWQWKKNGTSISGATASVYFAKSSGEYTVKITESAHGCTVVSNKIQATMRNTPSAVITPASATSFCAGGNVLLNANTGNNLTYQWKKNNANISSATGNNYTASVSGNYKVKVTSFYGCTKISAAVVVTVNTVPSVSYTGLASTYDVNALPATLLPSPSGGVFSGPGISGYTFFPSIAGIGGPYSITYTYTDGNGCSGSDTQQTTVTCLVPAVPSAISVSGGPSKVCPGDSRTYTVSAVSGATSYTWTAPAGGVINSGQGTSTVVINFGGGFTADSYIRVKANNACGSSAKKSLLIQRNNPATPGAVSGQAAGVCNQAGVIYSVPYVAGITYAWSYVNGAGATVAGGQGTSAITANYTAGYTVDTLRVNANNACGTSAYKKLVVIAAPATPASIAGSTAVCANQQNVAYSISPLVNATNYTWTGPAGSHISDGINTSPGLTLVTTATSVTVDYGPSGGTLKVRGNNSCGSGTYKNATIAIVCKEAMSGSGSDFEVTVSPNPSSKEFVFTVSGSPDENILIEIFDVTGRLVLSKTVTQTSHTLAGNALSPGLYMALVTAGDERKTIRIVKTH